MAKSRRTGSKAGKAASKVLRDRRTSKASKTAAGSALSQRAPKKKGSQEEEVRLASSVFSLGIIEAIQIA